MKERFVTTLKPETIKALKILAIKEGKNVNDLIEEMAKEKEKKEVK